MPSLKLAFTLAAAAYAVGKYIFSGEDDNAPPPPPPPRDSYYPSSSYNSGTTRTQTQQSYGPPPSPPPPPPPYTYRPPATNVSSQTTARTPALSVHGRGIDHPSVPHPRTPSQPQPSSSAHDQNTARTSAPHDYDRGVDHSSVASPYSQTPSQTQLSSTRTQASRQYSCACGKVQFYGSPEYEDEHRYEDEDDYGYQDEYEYGYQDEVDYGYEDEVDYGHEDEVDYGYQDEDDYGYQEEDEVGYIYEDEYRYEEDEDENGDEYEYLQTTPHVPSYVHTGGEPHSPIVPVGGVSSHPHCDEPAGVEDLRFAKKLREQARRKGQEMSEARRRAKSAKKKRRLGAAHAHTQDAIAHENEMKELDKRAAEIFFRENNKNRREGGKIDLHGLHVDEALQFAKDQLQTARSRGDEIVRFIVGKGLHSDAGEAKIRPALERFFTKRGLIHSLDPKNAGVLIVQLN